MRDTFPKTLTSFVVAFSLVSAVPVASPRATQTLRPAAQTPAPQTSPATGRQRRGRVRPTPSPTPRATTTRHPTPTPTPKPTPRQRPRDDVDEQATPTPTPTPERGDGGIGPGGWALIIGGIVGGAIIADKTLKDSDSKKLSKDGPQFPERFSTSDLTLKAFVRGAWPLFIAYELEQPGLVTLEIQSKDGPPFVHTFGGTRPGRHEEMFALPAQLGDKPLAAVYSIKAVSDATPAARPVPLHLYAFGAGDKAVGSSGFDWVNFQPGTVVSHQRERASYSFHAIRDFTKATADFMRLGRGPDREIVAQRVARKDFKKGVRRGQTISGDWDCQPRGRASVGLHELYVRGWRGLGEGGDWMVTSSVPQRVLVQ